MINTQYLFELFDPTSFNRAIEIAAKHLEKIQFEAIAVTGNSGTIFGGALAFWMEKKLILVRKESDTTHSFCRVEGDCTINSWIFIDDRIVTGTTFNRVTQALFLFAPQAKLVGSYLYHEEDCHIMDHKKKRTYGILDEL
jgi:phosphoribosylpyrophosphate synthetase